MPAGEFHINQPTPQAISMLNALDYFDKSLLKLACELRDLQRRRYTRIALEKPIQCGWRRFHILAPKAENRADRHVLLALLAIAGTVRFHKSPDFRRRRDRRWRRHYVELEQPLREIRVGEWDSRRLPSEWLRYFRFERRSEFCPWQNVLIFAHPHVFALKIEPDWITETYGPDPIVEERIAEIEKWLWNHRAMPRLRRLSGDTDRWRDPTRRRALNKIAIREVREAICNFPEVDPAAPVRRILISLWQTTLGC